MLVFDCETRTDEKQSLTFGSYRFIVEGHCVEEGLFYADDLTRAERAVLESYVERQHADTAADSEDGTVPRLRLLTLEGFLERFFAAAYKGQCLVVAFNFPFDISRLAYEYGNARGRFLGGFSFKLWHYRDKSDQRRANPYRVRVDVKHIDSKRALKGFTRPRESDAIDRGFRGHILDLRTLVFALTDRGYTLEGACEAFGVEHGKLKTKQHGKITPEYIDYNRRDVLATAELAEKVLAEYERHPIELQATKAYSPASIGKAYLRAMGIRPVLQRQPDFPKRYLGYAQSAFYGGRTSAHIRKIPVPVVYTDFLSQYSTVNVLMGLWRFVIAKEIRVVEGCAAELEQLLREVVPNARFEHYDRLFDRAFWKRYTGFARVIPDGDVLPLRAKYGSSDWQIGVNHVYARSNDPKDGLWYAWPDLVASVVLTGKLPHIVEAFKIEPVGMLEDLKPVVFRGQVDIDPRTDDFFKVVIEERQRLLKRSGLSKPERDMLNKALKTLGSATSYGIFAQMDRKEADDKVQLRCYGIDAKPYTCRVAHPEAPGEFCFSPLASLITSAGRLLLALLERKVADWNGTYAMEDTDSMAIVAECDERMIPCPGGTEGYPRPKEGAQEAIRAITWAGVRRVASDFAALNPYDPEAVPGSILKLELDNFDRKTGKHRQLWCYAISAKRYALFLRERDGSPTLLRSNVNNGDDRWSEHGLGHLLNPTDPEGDDREWIAQAWLRIIRKTLGLRTRPPAFQNLPAVGRTSVSSPWVMKAFRTLNAGKTYLEQIKPFNFLLNAHVRAFGYPSGVDPERFQLIAPYEADPKKWLTLPWIDLYSKGARRYRVATSEQHSSQFAELTTYGETLRAYGFHEEAKCAGPDGKPCGKQTVGLLSRRHVRIGALHFIGKESNLLEEVEAGQIHDLQDVYIEYPDARREREAWLKKVVPKLKAMSLRELQSRTGLSLATLKAVRAGRMPHPKNRAKLLGAVSSGTSA